MAESKNANEIIKKLLSSFFEIKITNHYHCWEESLQGYIKAEMK